MGRIILKLKNGKRESLKCKSKERAEEIAKKRKDVLEWNFYQENERVPLDRKKKVEIPQSFQDLERMMKSRGILY